MKGDDNFWLKFFLVYNSWNVFGLCTSTIAHSSSRLVVRLFVWITKIGIVIVDKLRLNQAFSHQILKFLCSFEVLFQIFTLLADDRDRHLVDGDQDFTFAINAHSFEHNDAKHEVSWHFVVCHKFGHLSEGWPCWWRLNCGSRASLSCTRLCQYFIYTLHYI